MRAAEAPLVSRLCGAVAVVVAAGLAGCTASGAPAAQDSPRAAAGRHSPAARAGTSRQLPACGVTSVLSSWSLRRRAAQLVIAPAGESAAAAAAPLAAAGAGGLILFGSSAPATLPQSLATVRRAAPGGVSPLIMTDEEGGEIQRMANVTGNLPWPRTMAQTMTTAQVQSLAAAAARRMRAAGVTMDLAPVLDLSGGPGPDAAHPDGPRSFSPQPATATAYGLAFARGLLQGGVIPVVKHFPGLGQASYNTDYGPASLPPLPQLEAGALQPFRAAIAAGLPAVMVSDAAIPGLTHHLPASLSAAAVTGLLRGRLGFHGLVITDSLSALAVRDAGYGVPAAAARAIEAGADMIMYDSADPLATLRHTVAAITGAVHSGQLTTARLDDAVAHVLAAKHMPVCPGNAGQ